MPMTHLPEISTENQYRFVDVTCSLLPNFSGTGLQ